MVKSPRGRCGPAPAGRGTGGITIGPLRTTLAVAGSGLSLDAARAAPGRSGAAAPGAKATAQVPTSNAPAIFMTFFIDVLASFFCRFTGYAATRNGLR